jgi:hypothetical protein
MKKKIKTWKPDPGSLRMQISWCGNGFAVNTAFSHDCPDPLGSVWFLPTTNAFGESICEIVDIYVPHRFQRSGVGTALMKFLLSGYGILRTGTGTKSGGMALMKSMGWKQNRQTGDWYLRGDVKKLST